MDENSYEKLTHVIQAMKVSSSLHHEIKRLARLNHRKITDQARVLMELGLQFLKEEEHRGRAEGKKEIKVPAQVEHLIEDKVEKAVSEKLGEMGFSWGPIKRGGHQEKTKRKHHEMHPHP